MTGPRLVPADSADAYVLRLDGMDQSHVDLADPTRLVFDYVRRLGDLLDMALPRGEPLRVLHIGGGALTLPRYVAATRPGSAQVVLEPDRELVALVRAEAPLPARSGIRIREADGREGLAAVADGRMDVVVLDAYDGGRVPGSLVSLEALGDMRRVLRPGGLLLANLTDRAPFVHARRVVAGVRKTFPELLVAAEPATLRGRRQGNLVLAAGATVPAEELAARARTGATPYTVLSGTRLSDTLGGGRAFTDADAADGPEPESAHR